MEREEEARLYDAAMRRPNQTFSTDIFQNFVPVLPDIVLDEINAKPPSPVAGSESDDDDRSSHSTVEVPVHPEKDGGASSSGPYTIDDHRRLMDGFHGVPYPFKAMWHYKFAEWIIKYDLSVDAVNELLSAEDMPFFNDLKESFTSHYTMMNAIHTMQKDMDMVPWQRVELKSKYPGSDDTVFVYRRKASEIVRTLLSQEAFDGHMHYRPVHRMEDGNRRVWQEMHHADWWADTQVGFVEISTIIKRI